MIKIPHSQPSLSQRDLAVMARVFRSGMIAQGLKVAEFEKKLSSFLKVKDAVAVNSGTAALHLALLALGVKKGSEVIVPAYACSALANAVAYTGASLRLADIDPNTFNISVDGVKKIMTRKTKAIIAVHSFGQPVDLQPLLKLDVPVIEDCAQAIGTQYRGRPVGSWGTLATFSFYATKVITTGEGGMLVSNDQHLLNKAKDLRDYDQKDDYQVRYNYKMTDLAAALGAEQLTHLPEFLRKRKTIAQQYHRAFSDLPLQLPLILEGQNHIYFRYIIRLKKHRSALMTYLYQNGIGAALPIFKPLHHYFHQEIFPHTDQAHQEALSIPIYPSLQKAQSAYIIQTVKRFFNR